ncbi:MAG: hypothetical protein N2645_10225 [Clostridia bacterium]|nr:hypothetical protein [Clostridia bacterium]
MHFVFLSFTLKFAIGIRKKGIAMPNKAPVKILNVLLDSLKPTSELTPSIISGKVKIPNKTEFLMPGVLSESIRPLKKI